MNGAHFRTLRARGAREPKKVYDMIIFMPRRFQRAIARPNPSNRLQTCLTLHLLYRLGYTEDSPLFYHLDLPVITKVAASILNITIS